MAINNHVEDLRSLDDIRFLSEGSIVRIKLLRDFGNYTPRAEDIKSDLAMVASNGMEGFYVIMPHPSERDSVLKYGILQRVLRGVVDGSIIFPERATVISVLSNGSQEGYNYYMDQLKDKEFKFVGERDS